MKFTKDKVLITCLMIALVICQWFSVAISPENKYSWLISLFIWVAGVYTVRKSVPMLIFYFFLFSYFFVPFHFFFNNKIISGYSTYFHEVHYLNEVSVINSMFIAAINCMLYGVNESRLLAIKMWAKKSSFIFYISLMLIIPLIMFGASGESILSGGYGSSVASKSAIYEYVAVLFIIPLVFYERKPAQTLSLIFVALYYIGKTLLYGSRLELIQLGLLLFFFYSDYARLISRVKLILMFCFAVLVIKLMGRVREDPFAFIDSLNSWSSLFSYFTVADTGLYLMTNSGDVFYASMRLLGLINIGILDIEYRFISFLSFIFNLPLSFSEFKNYSTLSSFQSEVYRTGGGGLISVYFYVWFGYVGVVLSGLGVGYIFKKLHSNCSLFFRMYGLSILITFPRWFPYSPIGFVKISIIVVIIYCLSLALSKEIKAIKVRYFSSLFVRPLK